VLWIDVTDLVEFTESGSTVTGVQRVEEQLVPLLVGENSRAVILDRTSGEFVEINYPQLTTEAQAGTEPINFSEHPNSVLLSLGATWINDQLMAAVRAAVSQGVHFVDYFYDLTPVLDAGHAEHLRPLFTRYLALLSDCADRVPAISQSSRNDLESYLHTNEMRIPPGVATTLPSGLNPHEHTSTQEGSQQEHGSNEYALMVGTIESRKNHLLAFNAWQELIKSHGAENIPTLICVGKIGWNSEEFQERLQATNNLDGKIVLRGEGVTDSELAQLYRDAAFTIYPSNYEGWGLPVSESLMFGTPVVAANNSSLTEAGGDLACYFPTGDLTEFINVLQSEMLDKQKLAHHRERIAQSTLARVTWEEIAELISQEVQSAREQEQPQQVSPTLLDWQTYSLAAPHTVFTDRLIVGNQRPPQPWGFPIYTGQQVTINFTREAAGELTVHLGTLCEAGIVTLQVDDTQYTFSRGEFVSITIGAGTAGESVRLAVSAADVGPSDQGFIGLTSITVEGESAMASEQYENFAVTKLEAENQALRADAQQLRNELDAARAELDRKSQSLLSRASRKLNRPSE
jgi:glycosyltransferase involved in cell wall biosynthesis